MFARINLVVMLIVSTAGCAEKDLSRDVAKKLIQEANGFATVEKVTSNDAALGRLKTDGWIKSREFRGWSAMADGSSGSGPYELTDASTRVFTIMNGAELGLRRPLHRTVTEVTGITEGPQQGVTKIAQFRWRFTDLSESVAKYTGVTNADHDGEASFRKFDDGWRVEEVKYGEMYGGGNPLAFYVDQAEIPHLICEQVKAFATPWEARATDYNVYSLGDSTNPDDAALRQDGSKTFADLLKALVPVYTRAQYISEKDPYGYPYQFSVSNKGKSYRITSTGKDGRLGGGDDFSFSDGEWVSLPPGIAKPAQYGPCF